MQTFENIKDTVDYTLQISIEDNQFDLAKLYGEAQKVGIDMGELEEYGFDSRGACAGMCSPFVFDSLDDYLIKANLFNNRLGQ